MGKTLIIAVVVALSCSFLPRLSCDDQAPEREVRVRVLDGKDSIHAVIRGPYTISDAATGVELLSGTGLKGSIEPTRNGISIPDQRQGIQLAGGSPKRITPRIDGDILVGWKRFRGDIDIIKRPDGKLAAINRIGIEKYLYGVLYHEISHRWPMEALKVQAIAARTYALYQISKSKDKPYDLTSDIYSQVYGGSASERWSTVRAVDQTKGMVLAYKGALFPAYFHATCAGSTENASNLWKINIPPLKGGVFCPYCRKSPHYIWRWEAPLVDVEKKLKLAGYKTGSIVSVEAVGRNSSGRVEKLEFTDYSGARLMIPAKDFRLAMGANDVRSTRFTLKVESGRLILNGLGWGHGVGMCQWGAYGLAQKGKTAEQILKFYYPGAEIASIDKVK